MTHRFHDPLPRMPIPAANSTLVSNMPISVLLRGVAFATDNTWKPTASSSTETGAKCRASIAIVSADQLPLNGMH